MLSVERRLQRVEDKLAIERVINEYAAALDARDIETYVALFAKNGEWINGSLVRKGEDEIRALVVGLWRSSPAAAVPNQTFEIVSNPEIEVDGDRATVRSRHLLMRNPEGAPRPVLAGRYEDELVREDGKWKFLRRVDYPVMPTADEWREIMRKRRAEQEVKASK
jgi:uncharacterized protein (TIGR02246 family)